MDAVAYALASGIPATYDAPNSWGAKTSLPTNRHDAGFSTLNDGTVLLTGGFSNYVASNLVTSYSPVTDSWTAKTVYPVSVVQHGQSTLADGTVLVTGGRWQDELAGGGYAVRYCRLYDPVANSWTTASNLPRTIFNHAQSTLADGTVLTTGGNYIDGSTASVSEVKSYDPSTNAWTAKANVPTTNRSQHAQSTLDDGTVLVTAGFLNTTQTNNVQSYNPATNTWTAKTALPTNGRYAHSQSTLGDGTALVVAGRVGNTYPNDAWSYDRVTDTWLAKSNYPVSSTWHLNQTTLADGTALVAGSYGKKNVQQYDPGGTLPTPGRAALSGYLAAN